MSADWHYADGASTRGPLTLAELTAALSFVPSPRDALVWRPGFENWRRAGEIRELAEAFFQPPPSPTAPSPPMAPPPAADGPAPPPRGGLAQLFEPRVNATLTRDPKLEGIGGWLVLVAIGQVLSPLIFLVSMREYYSTLDSDVMKTVPIAFAGEVTINLALGILIFYTAVLFFRKSRRFPMFFVYEIAASVLSLPVAAAWAALAISAAIPDQSAWAVFRDAFEPREVGQAIATGIVGAIWMVYLFKSRRAANTFTR